MAVVFLAVAVIAAAAPLNPAYGQSEFEFYLSDLEAKGIVLGEGLETAARAAAEKLGIPVLDPYVKGEAGGGAFEFSDPFPAPTPSSFGGPDDVALVLHTSGTARPKLVPLSHRNLCVSADHVRVALGLTEKDLCLNVMPLFLHSRPRCRPARVIDCGSPVFSPLPVSSPRTSLIGSGSFVLPGTPRSLPCTRRSLRGSNLARLLRHCPSYVSFGRHPRPFHPRSCKLLSGRLQLP